MAYDITHKNSTVAGTPPTASEIGVGEIAINAADATLYTKDTAGAVQAFKSKFTQSGTGAVSRIIEAKLQDIVNAKDFGAIGNGNDETPSVQKAIDSLGSNGGTVFVPEGVKFNPKNLTFPARFNLDYRLDDDLSQSGLSSTVSASGERVLFSSNSSYPADPTGGVVNEWRMTAPFHPGFVVDVRKDLGANIASSLGPGQTVNEPVRASWNITDEKSDRFRVIYENYLTPSLFSGVFLQGFKHTVRLNGIGTAQWSTVPATGTIVTGTTSNAKGYVVAVAAGYTDLEWFSGKFVAGETVSDNNETTTATITSVALTTSPASWLSQDLSTGAWTFGDRPPGAGTETLNVAGNIKVFPTRNGAEIIPKQVVNPVYVWSDNPEAPSPNQVGLMYPTSDLPERRRLQMVRQDLGATCGAIVPVAVSCTITSVLAATVDMVNVASFTKTATGKYTINFTRNLANPNIPYTTSLDGFYMQNWWVGVVFPTVGSVQLWVKNNAGTFADIPAGATVGLVGLGGEVP